MTNPLLEPWTAPFGLPPFDRIADDDFAPAFEAALTEARDNISAIAADPAAPDFANTIEALELAEERLDRVAGAFYNLAGSDANPAREALQRELAPKMAKFSSEVMMNRTLYERVRNVWEQREQLSLTPEQLRVLDLYHQMFVRAGAELDGGPAERFRAIKERLASLGTDFGQKVLAEERDWSMDLAEPDLEGLPEFLVEGLAAAAAERGREGWTLTLSRSLIVPFLELSPRRELRQRAYEAWTARGSNGNSNDTRAIVAETLKLRQERAELLGYPSYAAYKLEPEMAHTPERVQELLSRVWTPARAKAEADAEALTQLLHEDGLNGRLEPWDWRFYAARLRKAEHDLDEAALKPYLQLDHMVEAAFETAGRLFGLQFKPLDVPLYHADARAWEVTRDGRHMAVFIGDYFARPSKRSGAWCSAFRSQRKLGGEVRPIVVNVCNFAKPAKGQPRCCPMMTRARCFTNSATHCIRCCLT